MNFTAWAVLLALTAALIWFALQYYNLKKKLQEYARLLKHAPDKPPADFPTLEDVSNAVIFLKANADERLAALRAETERLSTILDQLADGVIIADANGLVRFINPAARRLFESADPMGRSVAELIRNHQLIESWRKCQQTREPQIESVEVAARKQFLQLIIIPDKLEGGSLLLAQDLTRVRRLETVRRDFISNVSHELRTPLASLKALTETLQNGALNDPEAGPRFLGRIATEVDALAQMAQELLDLSRIESGQVELLIAPMHPAQLLNASMDRMKMQAERAGLKLSVTCEDLPHIRADKMRMEQVLVNLIHNAVKFTKRGGEIKLSAELVGAQIRFAVRDTGAGISPENLTRIFERFYRADPSRTGSGTGLGLSISKHIIEAHHGKIWAESEEGKGSVFYFEIPL